MINGERVKQAREFRGLSQTELARRVGVTQPFIAQIEAGVSQPSEETVDLLAQTTGFPNAFFRQGPPMDFPLGSLLYRSRKGSKASERQRAYQHARVLFEFAHGLLCQVESEDWKLLLPRLDADPSHPIDPARAAQVTRTALSLPPDTPVDDLIREVEWSGVLVFAIPIELQGIDAFSLWAGPDIRRPVMVLSGTTSGDRLRFSMAHELGHLVMHQPPQGSLSEIEREADRFAAELLMPASSMRQEMTNPVTLTTLAQLKVKWKVSIQALARRAYDLNIISERQYHYLFEQLSAYGWRTREPRNLDVPVERPRALRQLAEMFYNLPADYERIARTTHLSIEDLRNMLEVFEVGDDVSGTDAEPPESNIVPFAKRK